MAKGRVIVKERNGGLKELRRRYQEAASELVEVGVFDDPELALIAAANEFGTATIPARPFMRQGLDRAQNAIGDSLQTGAGLILDGLDADTALTRTLVVAKQVVLESLGDPPGPPNDPDTVEAKGSDQPLEDEGNLKRAFEARISSDRKARLRESARELGGGR